METYSIETLRKCYERMQGNNFEKAYSDFCKEMEKVPAEYYSNIFFPGKAGNERIIAMDFILENGHLYYNVKPSNGEGTKKAVRFDQYPDFSTEVARNIIGAIEVSEISHKAQEKEQQRIDGIRQELEKSEERIKEEK